MKKLFAMLVGLGLLILTVGGCDTNEPSSSASPESASESASADDTTTTTEKATSAQEDTAHTTALHCRPTNTTTRRDPLTSRITTTTDWGSVTVSRTYPTAPFTVGADVREQDEHFTEDFCGTVITSKTQLDALALGAEYGTERYTEQYFEDKALVVLEFRLTSGSIRLQVDTVGVNGNTMTVFYTTVRPNPFANDMAYHRILLEISQKDADGIEHIVGDQVPIQLPSGSPPNPTAL